MSLDMTYFNEMEAKIPHGKVRTRFAPSPTGYMHVGNLRTALYTWLIARNAGGTFILRIEDTDQGRLIEGATDVIYRTLAECGLDHDEGPDVGGPVAPYIQSERRDTYGKYAELLVERGGAYYCFCEKMESAEDSGEFDRADDPCRDLPLEKAKARVAAGEPYVVRQRIPKACRPTTSPTSSTIISWASPMWCAAASTFPPRRSTTCSTRRSAGRSRPTSTAPPSCATRSTKCPSATATRAMRISRRRAS